MCVCGGVWLECPCACKGSRLPVCIGRIQGKTVCADTPFCGNRSAEFGFFVGGFTVWDQQESTIVHHLYDLSCKLGAVCVWRGAQEEVRVYIGTPPCELRIVCV